MRTADYDAVILCGGLGTRLRTVVDDRPKPMAMIDDRPFLEYVVDHLVDAGCHRLIFCTGHKGEWIETHFRGSSRYQAVFSRETENLGTAGALRHCRGLIATSPFLVVNGDSFCALDYWALLKAHCSQQRPVTVAVVEADGRSDAGSVELDHHGRIVGFQEKGTSGAYVSAGIYACDSRFLDSIPERRPCSLEYDVFPALLSTDIGGFVVSAPLYDIGTPARLNAFRSMSRKRLVNSQTERAGLNRDEYTSLYRKLLLVRQAEEAIRAHYASDEMKTPVHLGIGGEAISVGVCHCLPAKAVTFGTYRNHALYLAMTEDLDGFFGELFGKATGAGKGKAGSMHLCRPDLGVAATSAVVATTIPLAVGAALAHSYRNETEPVVVFFGDGAVEEGVFWESLNFACLHRLKILFVCEDNGLAIHAHASSRKGYRSLVDILQGFRCGVASADGSDLATVVHATRHMLAEMARSSQPGLLHLTYFRLLEHVGIHEDFSVGYRSGLSTEEWKELDPVERLADELKRLGHPSSELDEIRTSTRARIAASIARARAAVYPPTEALYEDVIA